MGLFAWQDTALCRDFPTKWWFPEQGGKFEIAVFICKQCPIQQRCLDYAIKENIAHGIWGGLTESKRRAYKQDSENKKRSDC